MSSATESMCQQEGGKVKEVVKRKTRNLSEKKRRDQFNVLVNELYSMVATGGRRMDKTTVLKGTIAFLRKHKETLRLSQAHEIQENWKPCFLSNDEFAQLMLEALNTFISVITQDGTILYTSDSVVPLLNYLPTEIVNRNMLEMIHPEERQRVKKILCSHLMYLGPGMLKEFERIENQLMFSCHIRMGSCTSGDAEACYEHVEFKGHFRSWNHVTMGADQENQADRLESNVCFCCSIQVKSFQVIRELPTFHDLNQEFTSRNSLEWKFLFLDHRGPAVIGYLPFEVLGTSGYHYYHPDDLDIICEGHKQLMHTGEGTSCYYRFLTKGQEWLWLQTHYYITYHQWSSKPEFVVCTNRVIGSAEVKEKAMTQNKREKTVSLREAGSCGNDALDTPIHSPSSVSSDDVISSLGLSTAKADQSQGEDPPNLSESGDPEVPDDAPASFTGKSRVDEKTWSCDDASDDVTGSTAQTGSRTKKEENEAQSPAVHSTQIPLELVIPQHVMQMSPTQYQFYEQLREKHRQLQETIVKQQQELRWIWDQLFLTCQLASVTDSQAQLTGSQLVVTSPSAVSGAPSATPLSGLPQPNMFPGQLPDGGDQTTQDQGQGQCQGQGEMQRQVPDVSSAPLSHPAKANPGRGSPPKGGRGRRLDDLGLRLAIPSLAPQGMPLVSPTPLGQTAPADSPVMSPTRLTRSPTQSHVVDGEAQAPSPRLAPTAGYPLLVAMDGGDGRGGLGAGPTPSAAAVCLETEQAGIRGVSDDVTRSDPNAWLTQPRAEEGLGGRGGGEGADGMVRGEEMGALSSPVGIDLLNLRSLMPSVLTAGGGEGDGGGDVEVLGQALAMAEQQPTLQLMAQPPVALPLIAQSDNDAVYLSSPGTQQQQQLRQQQLQQQQQQQLQLQQQQRRLH